jgi:hypothetical protein
MNPFDGLISRLDTVEETNKWIQRYFKRKIPVEIKREKRMEK